MASILIVCTGNICRSPLAEGFLRRALEQRTVGEEFDVSSAGTWGWEDSPAVPEAVGVGFERGIDISGHVGRRLEPQYVDAVGLVLGMTSEHRAAAVQMVPGAEPKTFTLKELVRLLDDLPATGGDEQDLAGRIARAAGLRRSGFEGKPLDEDVVDPLGMPIDTYRAVAWEIEQFCERLADGLVGKAPAQVASGEE